MPLSWTVAGSGDTELFCVQWNVSMETGLLTFMDKLIKHSSNRNPNQSLNQWLIPAVSSPCNQPGNCFTWHCLVGAGKSRSAVLYKAWISEKTVLHFDKKFNPQHRFLWSFFFSCLGSALGNRHYLSFPEGEVMVSRSYCMQVTRPLYITTRIQANSV